jgi:hypothetical protein
MIRSKSLSAPGQMHFRGILQILQTVQMWVLGDRLQPPAERVRRFLPILSALVLLALYVIPYRPSNPHPNQLANAGSFRTVVELTAIVWLLGSILTVFFVRSIESWLRQYIERIALVVLFLAVLRRYSDVVNDFLTWSNRNRQELLLIYPALILLWLLLRLVPGQILPVAEPLVHAYVQFRAFAGGRRRAAEILRSARPEAGHALVCSAFDTLPASFYAEVTSELECRR